MHNAMASSATDSTVPKTMPKSSPLRFGPPRRWLDLNIWAEGRSSVHRATLGPLWRRARRRSMGAATHALRPEASAASARGRPRRRGGAARAPFECRGRRRRRHNVLRGLRSRAHGGRAPTLPPRGAPPTARSPVRGAPTLRGTLRARLRPNRGTTQRSVWILGSSTPE